MQLATLPDAEVLRAERALDLELADRAEGKLRDFVRQAWHITEPGTKYVHGWHVDAICDHLEGVTAGHIRFLLINIPPRFMKSLTVAVFWPCWEWARWPHRRWVFASYAASLSVRDSLKCRRLIQSPWYQANWGHVFRLAGDQNVKSRFENDKTGFRLATSVDGLGTGEGGDRLVIDDAHNVKEAHSDTIREGVLRWYDEVWSTRMNDPNKSASVVIGQRVHEADISGHLMERGGYTHLMLPAEFEPDRKCFTDLGGIEWQDPRSEDDELLWPDHFGPAAIAQAKKMGSYGYAGQFQQRPAPEGGGLFKRQYYRYYSDDGDTYTLQGHNGGSRIAKADCWIFQTCDPAGTTKSTSDYFVVSTWAVTKHNQLLLLDVLRTRLEGPDQPNLMHQQFARWSPQFQAVEKKFLGLGLFQQLQRDGLPVREMKADVDKFTRALPIAARYESGDVFHPTSAPWLNDWEAELLTFPNGTYDDQVDTASGAGQVIITMLGPTIHTVDSLGLQ